MRMQHRDSRRARRATCGRGCRPTTAGALRLCPGCGAETVILRAAPARPLEMFCERVCARCDAVLGSYAGTAAEHVVRLWARHPT